MRYCVLPAACALVWSAVAFADRIPTSPSAPPFSGRLEASREARAKVALRQRTLSFEPNHGQAPAGVDFLSRGAGYLVYLSSQGAQLRLDDSPSSAMDSPASMEVQVGFLGQRAAVRPEPLDRQLGISNYFVGPNPTSWRTGVPNYAKVRYQGIYEGVDVIYYGHGRRLEYDFVVAPGADPNQIRLAYGGASGVEIDSAGDLLIRVGSRTVRQHRPVIYQQDAQGRRTMVAGRYVALPDAQSVRFALAGYDRTRPLVIDPVLDYTVLIGGTGSSSSFRNGADDVRAFAVDTDGSTVLVGNTRAVASRADPYPATSFPAQDNASGLNGPTMEDNGVDVFVTKMSADGSQVIFSTFYGGMGNETGRAVALDAAGNIYFAGETALTSNFPRVPRDATNPNFGYSNHREDAWIAKLSPDGGQLLGSRLFGGRFYDVAEHLVVTPSSDVIVVGETVSDDLPVTTDAAQARAYDTRIVCTEDDRRNYASSTVTRAHCVDLFVLRLRGSDMTRSYSSYLGGNDSESIGDLASDTTGALYLTGTTASTNFFGTSGAVPTDQNAFILKLNATGSAPEFSRLLGGSGKDFGRSVAVDASRNVYVTGYTLSANFLAGTPRTLLSPQAYNDDVFLVKLTPSGNSIAFLSMFGGSGVDQSDALEVDPAGNVLIAGRTNSLDFSTIDPVQPTSGGNNDAFLVKVHAAGNAVLFSSYFGGREDTNRLLMGLQLLPPTVQNRPRPYALYVAGTYKTVSSTPVNQSAHQFRRGPLGGDTDIFVAKFTNLDVSLSPAVISRVSAPRSAPGVESAAALTGGDPGLAPKQGLPSFSPGESLFITTFVSAADLAAKFGPADKVKAIVKVPSGAELERCEPFACALSGKDGVVDLDKAEMQQLLNAGGEFKSRVRVKATFDDGRPITAGTQLGVQLEFRANLLDPSDGDNSVQGLFEVTPSEVQVVVRSSYEPNSLLVVGQPCASPCLRPFLPGSPLAVSAPPSVVISPDRRAAFERWEGSFIGPPPTSTSISVTVPASGGEFRAVYRMQNRLTITSAPATGGSVAASPSLPSDGFYDSSATAMLTAIANPGFRFAGFTGVPTPSANPYGLAMSQPYAVTASFVADTQAQCVATGVSPTSLVLAAPAVGGPISAQLPPGCTATGASDAAWLTSSTTGSTVTYAATANTTGEPRTATLTVSGVAVPVTQRRSGPTFADVTPEVFYFDHANSMRERSITSGCGTSPLRYCGEDPITRGQMAVFLVRSALGTDTFDFTQAPHFDDVAPSHQFFRFIQKLRDLGVTLGCGPRTYCPEEGVTRGQMSAFIIRSRIGPNTPFQFAPVAAFEDVQPTHLFFSFIQKMREAGITSGCRAATSAVPAAYCPDAPVTRGQMAVFLLRGLFNDLLTPGEPRLASVSPGSLQRGQSGQFTVTGVNTAFVAGTTVVGVGPVGVTVGTVIVMGPTSLTVTLTAATDAALGPRSLSIRTGQSDLALPNRLQVTP